MKISLISIIARDRAIGYKNRLLCHMPADLAYFKSITIHKPIIIGRRTYESIGKPLPNRDNLIITSNPDYQAPGCKIFTTIQSAISSCNTEEVMIIGGASIYRQALPFANYLYLTFIEAEFPLADTFFPKIDFNQWQEIKSEPHHADKENPYPYRFAVFERINYPTNT